MLSKYKKNKLKSIQIKKFFYRALKDYEQAIESLDIISFNYVSIKSRKEKALSLKELKKYEEPIESLAEALSLEPKNEET